MKAHWRVLGHVEINDSKYIRMDRRHVDNSIVRQAPRIASIKGLQNND